jgi:hypothetical protein
LHDSERFFLAAYLAGPVILFPAWILVVLIILVVPKLRRHWRRSIATGVGLSILTYALSGPFVIAMAAFYTYHLEAPRTLDGIYFPAGSKVELSMIPPHHLMQADVPAPTDVRGMKLIGAFWMSPPSKTGLGEVLVGTLAANASFHGMPCGPGKIANTGEGYGEWVGSYNQQHLHRIFLPPNKMTCTLESDFSFAGVVLSAGTGATIWFPSKANLDFIPASATEPAITGELAQGAVLHDVPCAPGPVFYDRDTIKCILAADQIVHGFHFAAGHEAHIDRMIDSFGGTLAEPREVFGITVPKGTEVSLSSRDENSWTAKVPSWVLDDATVTLSSGVELTVHGATVRGRMQINLSHRPNIAVRPVVSTDYPNPGFISFEGRQHEFGDFDGRYWTFRN